MALSNLRYEPRREIIEQVVGLAAVLFFGGIDYCVVSWLGATAGIDIFFGMFLGVTLFFLFVLGGLGVAILIHTLGEMICGWMRNIGIDPRPKQRY